nr:PREDICTED: ornithine decarboxylase 1 [Tribolium castaneum]XP_968571.3 PREDICTED: ornithine decarboxylase 1 [Tribolium castaneum]|eukprot:XP_008200143.1 PREDICTED: ornithine decarboxylase 1 [Tribolium castaneum]
MKFTNTDERVHVLDAQSNVWSVIMDIADSGVQEEAFYVCDVGDIVRKHKTWKAFLPRVQPHYAVKCNDSLTVLEVLAALGTGFDCASKGEINKVLSLGVSPDRIIFANPAKPSSHIRHAAATNVSTMTFDNETELHKIKNFHPDSKLVIRIRCDATDSQCPLGMKFGCDPVLEAPRLLQTARSLNLNVIGVSFHVGSGCREPSVFKRAIAMSREVFDLGQALGYNFTLLDIGGGFPGDRGTSLDEIAQVVNSALDDYFPDPSVEIIAEPGRFYVSSAYTLICNIHSIRDVISEDETTRHRMYYINDGVYGSFNCILYDHQRVVPLPLHEVPGSKYYSSSIWGPTCDGLDQVVEEVLLPEMGLGDWLVFENMGAYTLPVASPFNGFPVAKVHVVADESIWVLLKDIMPLTEEHFVMGDLPANVSIESGGNVAIELPIRMQVTGNDSIIEEHVLEFAF